MPGYQSSGSEALQHLAEETRKEKKAVEQSEEFAKAKAAEEMARRVAAFGDRG